MAATREFAPLVGASLLSAVGSLPSHLAPLIVAALISESVSSSAAAGWIPSALLLGQLFTSLVLPAVNVASIRRGHAAGISVLLLGGIFLSGSSDFAALLLSWFFVGGCCGSLQYLGTVAAAHHSRPSFAFSLRLGVVLLLAGAISGVLQATGAIVSYHSLLPGIFLAIGSLLAVGLVLYRPARGESAGPKLRGVWTPLRVTGLPIVFLLFIGQTGFLAYVVNEATDRGISLEQAVWAIAGMKIAAGACLVGIVRMGGARHGGFFTLGMLLGGSVVVASLTVDARIFFAALFGFELAFNLLSARLQAAIATTAPQFAGRWLGGAILLGAAVGPVLHGAAIGLGVGSFFIAFSVLAAFAPGLWTRSRMQTVAQA